MLHLNQSFSKKFHKKKLDNKGASLVMVLSVMALIFVLVTIILMITATNLFMKDAARRNSENFYDAESVIDEIKAGLEVVCYDAYSYASREAASANAVYREAIYKEKYAEYLTDSLAVVGSSSTGRKYQLDSFKTAGTDARSLAGVGLLTGEYDKQYDGIKNCLKSTVKNSDGIGGEVLTNDADAYMNVDTVNGVVELKNISVQYTDKHDYVTKITTDVKLACPPSNIGDTATLNNILYYTIITDDSVYAHNGGYTRTNKNKFEGNMFVGYNQSNFENYNVDMTPGGGSSTSATQICYFIGGGTLRLNHSDFTMKDSQMWVQGLSLLGFSGHAEADNDFKETGITSKPQITGPSTFDNSSGDTENTRIYMQDDLALGANAKVKLKGQLVGFGNDNDLLNNSLSTTDDLKGSSVMSLRKNGSGAAVGENLPSQEMISGAAGSSPTNKTIRRDIIEKPYEYNSAVLVNGKNTELDLTGLTKLSLAGNAYVNANNTDGTYANNDIRTGESISIKSNQRAYLVPAELLKFNANPVNATDFTAQYQAIQKDYWDHISSGKYTTGVLAGSTATATSQADVPISTLDFLNGGVDGTWHTTKIAVFGLTFDEIGVDDIRLAAFKTGSVPVYYFFMHFKDDESASNFYNMYFNVGANKSTLTERLSYFTNTSGAGLSLPTTFNPDTYTKRSDSNFYFNGSLVATNKGDDHIKIPDTMTEIRNTATDEATGSGAAAAKKNQNIDDSGALFDSYYSLQTALTTRYDELSPDQKRRTMFDNIVVETKLKDVVSKATGDSDMDSKSRRYYVSDTGQGAILCYNVDPTTELTINSHDLDKIKALYTAGGGDAGNAKISLIVTNTNLKIDNIGDFSGLILSKGKVDIGNDMDITQAPADVVVALNAVNNDPDYNIKIPREIFWNPANLAIGGTTVTGSVGKGGVTTVTLPSLVTYDNWVRE